MGNGSLQLDVPHHKGKDYQKALVIDGPDLYEIDANGNKRTLSFEYGYNE